MIYYSPNVHSGGGAALQQSLIEALNNDTVYLDSRYLKDRELNYSGKVITCNSSFVGRLKSEYSLKKMVTNNEKVLCFHNLPPIFEVSGHVTVFFQNLNIIDSQGLNNSSIRVRFRCYLERILLSILKNRVDKFVVQSEIVKNLLVKRIGIKSTKIDVFPFMDVNSSCAGERKLDEFIYVADGVSHKNHIKLVNAWSILANQGYYPSLVLTLGERDNVLWEKLLEEVTLNNLRVKNIGHVSNDLLSEYYRNSTALIFPSLKESFGLPLIEATAHEMPILASELDYVREICEPIQTFDPSSPLSISRSVARFMNYKLGTLKINKPKEFLLKYFTEN